MPIDRRSLTNILYHSENKSQYFSNVGNTLICRAANCPGFALVSGVPGGGYNAPDFRGFKLENKITKIGHQNV